MAKCAKKNVQAQEIYKKTSLKRFNGKLGEKHEKWMILNLKNAEKS
jgi:hypothetical protein